MKTIKHVLMGAALLSLFLTQGCIEDFTIRGNGIEASESRITANFYEVQSEGEFDVHITPGNRHKITVIAESNILPYIETDTQGGKLRLHIRGIHHIKNQLPMEVFITTPDLHGIVLSGSGSVSTGFFVADDFDVLVSGSGIVETAVDALSVDALVSGSGSLYLSGVSGSADYSVSGSGKIDAYDLAVLDCEAHISGSGNVFTQVEKSLKATISGSGSIYYFGSPDLEMYVSGSGRVIREN